MKIMRFLKCLLSLSICCSALVGDYIVFKSKYSSSQNFRAFSDSTVHGAIGLLSSLLFFTHELSITCNAIVWNVIFCTILSSFIDVDHAIAARSLNIKDMTNLKQRGIFHCTTLWLLISTLLFLYSYLAKKINLLILTFMVIVAYTSHHIRDGNRRGLWLYPFGSTPPISKIFYIVLSGALPNLFGIICRCLTEKLFRHNIVDIGYKMVV